MMAEKQYLICDCTGSANLEILTEATGGSAGLVIRGKFQEVDIQNKNKRIYPRSVLEPQVEALQGAINEAGLVGELDHPTDSIIHFENASHMITKLYWDGNALIGEARVLNTPAGKILAALIGEGVKIGISSRGVGSGHMNREGITVINDGFKLITFDIVADPSTPGSFLRATESLKPSREEDGEIPTATAKTETTTDQNTDETRETQAESTDRGVDTVLKPEVVEGFLQALFRSKA